MARVMIVSISALQCALMSSEHASSFLREARQPVDRSGHFFGFHFQLSSFQRPTYFGARKNLNCVRQLFRRLGDSPDTILLALDAVFDDSQFSG